jgi:hypothetical protein
MRPLKQPIFLLLIFLGSSFAKAQFSSVIVDSLSGNPIPFVNIWVQEERVGTTSNRLGNFSLEVGDSSKTIIISAVGYKLKKIVLNRLKDTTVLAPVNTLLEEVTIRPMLGSESIVVNPFKKRDGTFMFFHFQCSWLTGEELQLLARKFQFNERYAKTPFLTGISLLTDSDVKEALFRLRFYSVNDTGGVGSLLINTPVAGVAQKGIKKTFVDLAEHKIKFPEKGLFIAIEHLGLAQNEYLRDDDQGSYTGKYYAPVIGSKKYDEPGFCYHYYKSKWYKRYFECLPAMELILSN